MAGSDNDSPSILKFFGGVLLGVVLTVAYVRYAWTMPAVLQVPGKITEAAVVTAAELDLFDPEATDEVRHRALTIVISQKAEDIAAFDQEQGYPLLEDLLRRKAERAARLLKHQYTAWDAAMDNPSLRGALERKHGATDNDETLKRRMMIASIQEEEYLAWYLQTRFPQLTPEDWVDHILTVYRHGLRTPPKISADNGQVVR